MMIVLAVIGIAISVFSPMLKKRPVEREWDVVLDALNDLVTVARQEALMTRSVHRLVWRAKGEQHAVVVEKEEPDPERPTQMRYVPAQALLPTKYTFPEGIFIKALYLGKQELLESSQNEAGCYVTPEGIVQPIMTHLIRKDIFNEDEDGVSLVIQPFLGKFVLSDGFLKPGNIPHEE